MKTKAVFAKCQLWRIDSFHSINKDSNCRVLYTGNVCSAVLDSRLENEAKKQFESFLEAQQQSPSTRSVQLYSTRSVSAYSSQDSFQFHVFHPNHPSGYGTTRLWYPLISMEIKYLCNVLLYLFVNSLQSAFVCILQSGVLMISLSAIIYDLFVIYINLYILIS